MGDGVVRSQLQGLFEVAGRAWVVAGFHQVATRSQVAERVVGLEFEIGVKRLVRLGIAVGFAQLFRQAELRGERLGSRFRASPIIGESERGVARPGIELGTPEIWLGVVRELQDPAFQGDSGPRKVVRLQVDPAQNFVQQRVGVDPGVEPVAEDRLGFRRNRRRSRGRGRREHPVRRVGLPRLCAGGPQRPRPFAVRTERAGPSRPAPGPSRAIASARAPACREPPASGPIGIEPRLLAHLAGARPTEPGRQRDERHQESEP